MIAEDLHMIHRNWLTLLLLCGTFVHVLGQERFPALSGETVEGTRIVLPEGQAAPFTIVGLAYGQKAGPLLEEWYGPAYLRFVAKHGLFAAAYDARVYFVPLFVGANKAAYEPSIRKFRKSADPAIVDHVLFSKDELAPLQQALGLKDKEIPYFFVLNAKGEIIHRTQGAFSDDKLDAMEEVLLQ
jgi:hypothetical protein